MSEFAWIEKYFVPLTCGHAEAGGLAHDTACLAVPEGQELIVSTDMLHEGVHFLPSMSAAQIAHKALRVNLSDLAAAGAKPYGYQLALGLPENTTEDWIADFTAALAKDQNEFGLFLSGGDTTRTNGPLSISITVFGLVPQGRALTRTRAQEGDLVVLTGTVGDAYLGLSIASEKSPSPPWGEGGRASRGRVRGAKNFIDEDSLCPSPSDPVGSSSLSPRGRGRSREDQQYLIQKYMMPTPRISFASALQKYAHAAVDVSDGLLADLGHICTASDIGADIHLAQVAFSKPAQHFIETGVATPLDLLTGGDDYELLIAIPPEALEAFQRESKSLDIPIQTIGHFTKEKDVKLFDVHGAIIPFTKAGWQHF